MRFRLLISVAVGVAMLSTNAFAGDAITITGEKWPPYNNYVIDRDKPGFMFEIVKAIFSANGLRFVYTERPWARAISQTGQGAFNALIGPAKGDAPHLIFPREEIGFTRNGFFVRRESDWRFEGLESLEHVRLGVLKSMTYGAAMDQYIALHEDNRNRINIISGENYLARNFTKLKLGRIDATIDDDMVVRHFLQRTDQAEQFKLAGFAGPGYGIYIAFSPKFPQAQRLAELITAGVRKLRQEGELQRILAKYGAQDWK